MKMTQVSKIKAIEAEDETIRLRAKGLGSRVIARKLSEETGQKVSHMAVDGFLKSIPDRVVAEATEDYKKTLAEEIAELRSQHDALIRDTITWSGTVREQINEGELNVLDYRVCLDELEKRLQGKAKFLSDLYVPNKPNGCRDIDVVNAMETVKEAMERVRKEKEVVTLA
jgi:hypothetical protein